MSSDPKKSDDRMAAHRVAVVTGGGRGIGAAIVRRLAADGYAIAIGDYLADEASAMAAALTAEGKTAFGVGCDVRRLPDIADLFAKAKAGLGVPTVLVNNAGIYPNHPALEMTEENWDQVLNTNLKGSFFCAQALARSVTEAGLTGCIVNVASTSAFSARVGACHYSASKAAVVMMTKSLAQEFGPLGIRVNCVAPGLVEAKEGLVTEDYRRQFISMVPSGRIGRVDDIANVAAFLASPAADYVNGETIVVDGGFLTGRSLQRSS